MQSERLTVEIAHAADVSAARGAAKRVALSLGFSPTVAEEIGLVVTELASNLVKHAGGGLIEMSPVTENGATGIRIESHDRGPGFEDVELALTDGFSTAGSLGYGLGTVHRLMDRCEIVSQRGPDGGAHIVCKRFLRVGSERAMSGPLDIAAATRPHPLMEVNGDTFVIERWGCSALVGIVDGLGHGQFALRAAQTARQFVESHREQSLPDIFTGVGRACLATRGVVMALARFDWAPDGSRIELSFASIGNIEARVFGKPQSLNFVVRRGVLGGGAPHPVVTQHAWEAGYVMVLHSDGVSVHWRWTDYPDLAGASAEVVAARLLHRLAKEQDDATVLVVRNATTRGLRAGREASREDSATP